MKMPGLQYLSACLLLTVGVRAIVIRECGECAGCPRACKTPVRDPCGCCSFICAVSEGQPCITSDQCQSDLVCKNTNTGRVCSCAEDDRMVCGTNSMTYASICQFRRAENQTMQHWGPCSSKAEIVSGPSDRRLTVGEPLALDCEAKGYPIPTIAWTFTARDGTIMQLPSDDELIAVQLRGGPEHLMVTSWMQIVESRQQDLGTYTCTASNQLGSASAQAVVSLYGVSRHVQDYP